MSATPTLIMPSLDTLEAAVETRHRQMRRTRALRNTVLYLLVVAALVVLGMVLAFPVLRINGASMAPTLQNDSLVLVAEAPAYETGDVVAFHHNNDLLVKRVVATGGDWVSVDETGSLLVNGEPIVDASPADSSASLCDIELPLQVPDDAFFMVGDDRTVSVDSRAKGVGCVDRERVLGKVMLCLWPLDRFGFIG